MKKSRKGPFKKLIPTNHKLIQKCNDELSKLLSIIYRNSLDKGDLPCEWKQANVTAINNSGPKTKVENYRPILVLHLYDVE